MRNPYSSIPDSLSFGNLPSASPFQSKSDSELQLEFDPSPASTSQSAHKSEFSNKSTPKLSSSITPSIPNATSTSPLGHVLITGGCGFLGSHLARMIQERDYEKKCRLTLMDLAVPLADDNEYRLKKKEINHDNPYPVEYVACDISNDVEMRHAWQSLRHGTVDTVFHTASPHISSPAHILDRVNVYGTKIAIDVAKEHGVRIFVYTSSASVVMNSSMTLINVDERWPVQVGRDQPDHYARTKGIAEKLVLAANVRSQPFLTCAIRPSGIFGEKDRQLLPRLIQTAKSGKTKYVLGSDNNLFDFTYVENVVHAHLLAALHCASNVNPSNHAAIRGSVKHKVDGEVFFITNQSPIYFWAFARAVWAEVYKQERERLKTNKFSTSGIDECCDDRFRPQSKAQDGDVNRGCFERPRSSIASVHLPAGLVLWIIGLIEIFWILLEYATGSQISGTNNRDGNSQVLTEKQVRFSTVTRYYSIQKAVTRLGYTPLIGMKQAIERSVAGILDEMDKKNELVSRSISTPMVACAGVAVENGKNK